MPDLFIDGAWVAPVSAATRPTIDPATATVIREVDEAGPEDCVAAIAAARAAFDSGPWPKTPWEERAAALLAIADLLERDKESIAEIETADTGKTLPESRIDVEDVVSVFRYYGTLDAAQSRTVSVDNPAVVSTVVHEPIGVCVLIAPWNYPLLQISWKIAPALLAGCTMVCKPSEVTPLSTIKLVELIAEAGVPAGVVNLITGAGPSVGAALTDTPEVDFISFTGGLNTGRIITETAAKHVTKVAVELGGKNPHIVFADACATDDAFADSVDVVLTGTFLHSGQVCSAGTRVILEDSIADQFVAALAKRAALIRIGPGTDASSETGPLVSAGHREKVEGYVTVGESEGAILVVGGHRPTDPKLADGYYFLPTIFDHCTGDMRIVAEETFGPIMTIERFTDEATAIALGNDTRYGLAGGVRTADPDRADRVAKALRHGTVWINDFGYYTPGAEWGGFGASGNGRELGLVGLTEYQETKHIWRNDAPTAAGWFTGK